MSDHEVNDEHQDEVHDLNKEHQSEVVNQDQKDNLVSEDDTLRTSASCMDPVGRETSPGGIITS